MAGIVRAFQRGKSERWVAFPPPSGEPFLKHIIASFHYSWIKTDMLAVIVGSCGATRDAGWCETQHA